MRCAETPKQLKTTTTKKNITLKLIDPFCNCVDKGWHPIWKHRSILILLHFYGTKLFCTSLKQQNDFKMSMWCYLYPLVPKPPGSVIFSTRSNSSLQLQWAIPDEMIGAPDIIYSITYQAVGGLSQTTTSTQNNTLLLSLLDSGTKYNVTVKTTGPGNFSSTVVQNSFFTCKYNKKNCLFLMHGFIGQQEHFILINI